MHYKFRSNAKINLFLKILYKRNDGYHQIESIFLPISIADTIYIGIEQGTARNIEDIKFESINYIPLENRHLFEEVSERGNTKNNLVYKLFEKLFQLNIKLPVLKIKILKKIPPGSGVGGGSSNVATILRFLIQQNRLSFNDALKIAESIGSDIPFFIYNVPCFVTGRGEIVKPIDKKNLYNLENIYGIINFNQKSVSTKEAYKELKKPLQEEYCKIYGHNTNSGKAFFDKSFLEMGFDDFLHRCENDFERIILEKEPELLKIKDLMLKTEPIKVLMTGSGSAIFSLYNTKEKMLEALKHLKKIDNKQSIFKPFKIYTGQSPSGKASDFGSDMRRFESSLPSQ